MVHKSVPYALPALTMAVMIAMAVIVRPQITGFFAAPVMSAEIKITASEVLPPNAVIHIFLEKNNQTAMEIYNSTALDFVEDFKAQDSFKLVEGKNKELGYEGKGYIGSHKFSAGINTDNLKHGNYILQTEITWHDKATRTEQEIII
ncbi:MAG: hypothetical protein V1886_00635 [archaeon]